MTLPEEARTRLADVVRLQPTKNKELQERWGMESGSEVHQYLESELADYYYRDENSRIRATEEAASLVDVAPGIESGDDEGSQVIRVPTLHRHVLAVLPGPGAESQSVVSVLHSLREQGDEPSVEEVRDALRTLAGKGVVETIQRTVPTYRLALPRDRLRVERPDESRSEGSDTDGERSPTEAGKDPDVLETLESEFDG